MEKKLRLVVCIISLMITQHSFLSLTGYSVAAPKILMADGSEKSIETIIEGDVVISFDIIQNKMEPQIVTHIKTDIQNGNEDDFIFQITFADNTVTECTNNHVFYVPDKGYVSYKPERTLLEDKISVGQLAIGDYILKAVDITSVTQIAITSIIEINEPVHTYELIQVSKNSNYFANGMLVHNSDCDYNGIDDEEEMPPITPPNPGGSGNNDDDDNNGDDDAPVEPSPEEIADSQASVVLSSATEAGGRLETVIHTELQSSQLQTYNSTMEMQYAANAARGPVGGDPVLITTGKYIIEESDLFLSSSIFDIKRTYISDNSISGNLGFGWHSSLDTRLIRGTTSIQDSVLTDVFNKAYDLEGKYHTMSDLLSLFPSSSSITAKLSIIGSMYSSALQSANDLQDTADLANTLHDLNTYALFSRSPAYYEGTGNNTITLIDESGTPVLFNYISAGYWIPCDSGTAKYIHLESLDGKAADSVAGFVLSIKNGIKKYFNGYGLLTAIADRNGNRTEFLRDAGSGKVTRVEANHDIYSFTYENGLIKHITGPEGQSVTYAYSAGVLTRVTDTDGDTVKYEYTDDRLVKIIKPDNSFVQLEYGYTRADGTKLTTKTTHEEGASEKFDYYPEQKLTVYTDHSLVVTKYWYDDSHRTVREEHADGTIKTFQYNAMTGNLDSETLNGSITSYTYDARGNRDSVRYSDGSRETWIWNNLDEMTSYRDRDGVETIWNYDPKGNCTNIFRDGIQVFSGTYDGSGLLVSSKTGERESEYYTYDAYGNLAGKTTGTGSDAVTESWTSDAIGRVTSYVDGAGRKTTYSYSGKNVTERSPSGLERIWAYNNRKDLVSVTEKDLVTMEVRVTGIAYDKRHLPVTMTDGEGRVTEYAYREDGKLTSETTGKWTSAYRYDSAGRPYEIVKTMVGSSESYTERYAYSLTPSGEKKTILRPLGKTSVYQYDEWSRMTQVTNALSEISERTLSPGGRVKTEQAASGGTFGYTYDDSGRLSGIGKEHDSAVKVTYYLDGSIATKTDRNNNTTAYAYNDRGLLVTEETALSVKSYIYDATGRVTSQVTTTKNLEESGTGRYSTTWAYAGDGRSVTVTEGDLYPVVWSLNAWGEVVRKTDGEGNSFSYVYDRNGKLKTPLDGYGKPTNYTWNALGKVETVTGADGSTETYSYNHLGLVRSITDALGTSWTGTYDAAGRLIREKSRPGIDKEYAYDELDRITSIKSGGTVIEKWTYGNRGRTVTSIDGNSKSYVYDKDAFGVLAGETNRLGDSLAFEYDREGRNIGTKEFSGKTITTEFDDAKGMTTTRYRDGSESVIVKDASGRITRASGVSGSILYRYDEGGKLVRQYDENAGEESLYTYDKAGRRIGMDSGNREVSWRYGKNGELLAVVDNKQQLKVAFAYDVMGRETARTYGNGIVQETKYDKAGRTVMIRELSPRRELLRAEGYLYDEQGRRSHSIDEKGNVTVYLYDSQSRLETVLYPATPEKIAVDKAEAELSGLFFSAGKGNPERYTISANLVNPIREILDQMSVARSNIFRSGQIVWRESYTYDANGNRRTKTTPWGTITYAYDSENRLLSMGNTVYTYDKDGNLLGEKSLRKTVTYGYTDSNRMKSSIVTDITKKTRTMTNYAYDAFGRRTLVKDAGGETMRTLYDGLSFDVVRSSVTLADGSFTTNYSGGRITAAGTDATSSRYRWIEDSSDDDRYRSIDEDGYGTSPQRYTGLQTPLFANGETVAMNRSASTGNGKSSRGGDSYFGTDLMGSVRSATNEYGNVEDRYEYDAFGKPYQGDFSSGLNIGYTGKPYDAVTGMYDYGYRDYTPATARFTTVDPIRDGNNWFAYVNNDPVNFLDEFGLSASERNNAADARKMEAKIDAQTPIWPTESRRITNYFTDDHPLGIDIGGKVADVVGDPLKASMGGTVTTAGQPSWSPSGSSYIIVKGNDGYEYRYTHPDISPTVKAGDTVKKGALIATMGSIGAPGQVHLHYEIRKDGIPQNPLNILPK